MDWIVFLVREIRTQPNVVELARDSLARENIFKSSKCTKLPGTWLLPAPVTCSPNVDVGSLGAWLTAMARRLIFRWHTYTREPQYIYLDPTLMHRSAKTFGSSSCGGFLKLTEVPPRNS